MEFSVRFDLVGFRWDDHPKTYLFFLCSSPPHGGQVLAIPRTLVGDVLESMGFAKACIFG